MAVAGYVKVYAKRKGRLPKHFVTRIFRPTPMRFYAGNSTNSSSSGRGHAYPCLVSRHAKRPAPVVDPTRTSAQSLFIPPDIV